jgi:hypothetical protein
MQRSSRRRRAGGGAAGIVAKRWTLGVGELGHGGIMAGEAAIVRRSLVGSWVAVVMASTWMTGELSERGKRLGRAAGGGQYGNQQNRASLGCYSHDLARIPQRLKPPIKTGCSSQR